MVLTKGNITNKAKKRIQFQRPEYRKNEERSENIKESPKPVALVLFVGVGEGGKV